MTTWKSFLTRATSAAIALALITGLYYFFQLNGLKAAVCIIAVIGTWELAGILFQNEKYSLVKSNFILTTLLVFAANINSLSMGALAYSLALIFSVILVLLRLHKDGDLQDILSQHSKSALGLFYMGLLPGFAYRLLDHTNGLSWFVFLLAVVFAGDTLAYIFGVLMGKHKVMPSVSPKKTWEGSFGGILGSITAGLVCWTYLFPDYSLAVILGMSALSGFAGQFGDFFESLLKRVANVKDSGKIMPGHGGVLDRVDGVLFASPIVLGGTLILSHLLS